MDISQSTIQIICMEEQNQQMYFDVHNHLLDYQPEQLDSIIKEGVENNVIICSPNTTREDQYQKMINLAIKYPYQLYPAHEFDTWFQNHKNKINKFSIVPSFGIHPCFLQHEINNKQWKENLEKVILQNEKFAIGEIGIDYRKDILETNPKAIQNDFFAAQLQMSFRLNRTVTIHCVRAHGQLLKMLKRYNKLFSSQNAKVTEQQNLLMNQYKRNSIIMHSYGGSKQITASLLKLTSLDIYFSLCLKRSEELCEIIPLDRLILETDAPFQNNLRLLKEQHLFFGQIEQGMEKKMERENRMHYTRANIRSLCKYYKMQKRQFAKVIFQNSLKSFRLLI